MSIIRELIKLNTTQRQASTQGDLNYESSYLVTTDRLEIIEHKAELPSRAIGDLVFNMAYLFEDKHTAICFNAICRTDGASVIFEAADELNGCFCVVSYLTTRA